LLESHWVKSLLIFEGLKGTWLKMDHGGQSPDFRMGDQILFLSPFSGLPLFEVGEGLKKIKTSDLI